MGKRSIIITSAASAYGAACVRAFAAAGYRLILADESESAARALLDGLGEKHADSPVVIGSAANKLQIHNIIAEGIETYGRIDGLVHIAAIGDDTEFTDQSEEFLQTLVSQSLMGALLINQAIVRQFLKQDAAAESGIASGGVIVNIVQSGLVETGGVAGATIQAGVEAMSKTLAVRYAKEAIRANCISAGLISGAPLDDAILKSVRKTSAAHRLGDVQNVADAATYLAGEKAQFVSGTTLNVDGGGILTFNPIGQGNGSTA